MKHVIICRIVLNPTNTCHYYVMFFPITFILNCINNVKCVNKIVKPIPDKLKPSETPSIMDIDKPTQPMLKKFKQSSE